jgi:hypothetical protein
MSREQIRIGQPRHQLRDGGPGYASAARELRTGHPFLGDRAQREELGDRQRRLVPGEQPLDPTADEWRDGNEGFRSFCWWTTRSRH